MSSPRADHAATERATDPAPSSSEGQLPVGRAAGQQVRLLTTLRTLIRDYPAGIGIVKEFIQNADDAGASWLRVTLDRRTHGGSDVPSRLTDLLGPALLFESDQVFTDADLEAIRSIGDGSKQHDVARTGQFGLGFNTAYTVTDYPSFVTRDLLRCFDPFDDKVSPSKGDHGAEWSLTQLWSCCPTWLQAFGLKSGTPSVQHTIFRLPLRIPTQAIAERLQERPFSPEDVIPLFDEVEAFGAATLLFLRSMCHLEVCEIRDDGQSRKLLSIRTINKEEVDRSRLAIQIAASSEEMLQCWRADPNTAPRTVYAHEFDIDGRFARRECWLVSQSYEPGSDGAVLDRADDKRRIGQETIPKVGVACKLDMRGSPEPVDGYLFCTLPLPCKAGLNFHVNGLFDLDSSRRGPIQDRGGYEVNIRTAWNNALLQEAVPACARRLIQRLLSQSDNLEPTAFYQVWPDLRNGAQLGLSRAIVREFAACTSLRVRGSGNTRWVRPDQAKRPREMWPASLVAALQADGLEFVDPPLPEHVRDGLRHLELEPEVVTWIQVKPILVGVETLGGHHSEAPLCCIREPQHILRLLELFNETPQENLDGMPLSLRANGSLLVFSSKSRVFDADSEIRQLAYQEPAFFLDLAVAESLRARDVPGRIFIGPERIVDLLRWVWRKCSKKGFAYWATSRDDLLDLAWLEKVINFLAQHPPQNPREALQDLPLILDQAGNLHCLYSEDSPCSLTARLTSEEFDALWMLGVPTVGGPTSLRKALDYLLTRLEGAPLPTLAEAIAQRLLVRSDNAPVPTAWETLLDLLAKAHSVDSLPEATLKGLAQLRIWPTQDGLWAASDRRVYIPADFRSPSFGGDVQLLTLGDKKVRESLYRAMGARLFTIGQFVHQIFIQSFDALDDDTKNKALDWLAAQRSRLTERMVAELGKAPIAPTSRGDWVTPSQVYDPDATETHALLGEHGPVLSCPNSSESKVWRELFVTLGMARAPRAKDILLRIKDHATHVFTPEGDAGDRLKACFEHIVRRGEDFWNGEVDGHLLTEHLSKLAWLPAVRGDGPRMEYGVLFATDLRLYKAAELFARSEGFLAASQAPLSEFADNKGFLEKLGIRTQTPLDTARQHFEAVRDAFEDGRASDTCARNTAHCFYKLIGRQAPLAARLRQAMTRPEVLWDDDASCFRRAEHCFAEPVRYFLSLRAHVPGVGDTAAGMDLLGRRQAPEIRDLVAYLDDLATWSAGRPLDEETRESALHVLMELLSKLRAELNAPGDEWDGFRRVHVLDEARRLRRATRVLRDDAPWWAERIDRNLVALLDVQVGDELARFAGVRKISDVIKEELIVQPDSAQEGSAPWTVCKRLSQRLRSPAFEVGLRRLIYAKHEEANASLDDVFDLRFEPCAALTTVLSGAPIAPTQRFGRQDVIVYLAGDTVYIASESLEDALPDAAQAINRRLGHNVLHDLAPLEEILRVDASKIEDRLDRRRISRLPDAVEPPTQDRWTNNVGPPQTQDRWTNNVEPQVQQSDAPENSAAAGSGPDGSSTSSESPGGAGIVSPSIQSPSFLSTHGFPEREPTASVRPRDGRTRFSSEYSLWGRRGRLVTHLPAPTNSDGADAGATFTGVSEEARMNAISKAREYELGSGVVQTRLVDSPQDYPDFDLVRLGCDGQVERVIAVEAVAGVWNTRGVDLGSAQVHAARDLGDLYWVYVVEHADDPLRAQVYAIRSPISRSTTFQLDRGWRAYAERSLEDVDLLPAVGKQVYRGERRLGVIEEVKGEPREVDSVVVLCVRGEDGEIREMTWSRSLHRIVEENDG